MTSRRVAIVGNAAEHSTAVLVAYRNRMDLSLQIAVGSSIQVALFVAPLLVLLGLVVLVELVPRNQREGLVGEDVGMRQALVVPLQ